MPRPVSIEKLRLGQNSIKKPVYVKGRRAKKEEATKKSRDTLRFLDKNTANGGIFEDEVADFDYSDSVMEECVDLESLSRVSARLLDNGKEEDKKDSFLLGKPWWEKEYEEMSARDWRVLCEDFSISSKGNAEKPLRSWQDLGLIPKDLLDIVVEKMRFSEPTPIQRSAIPNALTNRDLVGVANTGSGKTLAFLLPILIKLSKDIPLNSVTKLDGPSALILVPTRELAQQIEQEAKKIVVHWERPCIVKSIVGGHSLEQISVNLIDGCEILVATPGRLIDCLDSHILVLRQVETLILDEADKMIDFGFEEQLTSILSKTEFLKDRQTMMFTATMSPPIEKIAAGYLKDPINITVGGGELKPKIRQLIEFKQNEDEKFIHMCSTLLPRYKPPIIIFINYKKTAEWLVEKFKDQGIYKVTVLHGSRSQDQREQSLALFRSGKIDIMIATDVAGRGIDIPNVSLVINFQMAKTIDSYIHRIGRTGRAGKLGTAITLLTSEEEPSLVRDLCNYIENNDTTGENEISREVKAKFGTEKKELRPIIF